MKELCKGELLLQYMNKIGGRIERYGVIAYSYESGEDENGVIRHCGFFLTEEGNKQ